MKTRSLLRTVTLLASLFLASSPAQADSKGYGGLKLLGTGALIVGGAAVASGAICKGPTAGKHKFCASYNPEASNWESEDDRLDKIIDPDDPVFLKSYRTKALRRALNQEQVASGMPPDPNDCEAHHIVPVNEGRVWAREYAEAARALLRDCEINIESVDNGVYLPSKNSGSGCEGAYHKSLHTKAYYENVATRLTNARSDGCDALMDELKSIKLDLIKGIH